MKRRGFLICGIGATAGRVAAQSLPFPGPGMPAAAANVITLVTHTVAALGPNGGTTSAIDTTGATLIVLGISYDMGGVPGSAQVTDSKGNSYTSLPSQVNGGGSGVNGRLFYAYAPTVGSGHTFTVTLASCFASICVQAFTGTVGSTLDVKNGDGALTPATTIQPKVITPTANNEVVVSFLGFFAVSGTASVDSGMTITDQVLGAAGDHYAASMAYKVQTTAAAINPTWTAPTPGNLIAVIGAFK